MPDVWGRVWDGVELALWLFTDACASMEPRSSIWILAAFGSAFSAFRGRHRGVIGGMARWIGGTFFSVAFVKGVDHFDPMAESFLIGYVSAEATKVFVENSGSWFAGVGGGIFSRTVGGKRAS